LIAVFNLPPGTPEVLPESCAAIAARRPPTGIAWVAAEVQDWIARAPQVIAVFDSIAEVEEKLS